MSDLIGAPAACIMNPGISVARSGIVRSASGTVGENFKVNAEWSSARFRGESSYCAAECGEYRQYVRGRMLSSSNPDGSNPNDVSPVLADGEKLDSTTFKEDALDGDPALRYGHRNEKQKGADRYDPEPRSSGPHYTGQDFPRIATGIWADIHLDFLGKTIDVCNGSKETSSSQWTVSYTGVIRPQAQRLPRSGQTAMAAEEAQRDRKPDKTLDPATRFRLQRAEDDRASSNLLTISRQSSPEPQAPEPTLSPDDFVVAGWEITPGPVRAIPQPDGRLQITSPDINIHGNVGLRPSRKLGQGVLLEAGPIQSVISDQMVAKFTEAGAANGRLIGEVHRMVPMAYDAASTPNPPWYTQDDSRPRLSDNRGNVNIHFYDRPNVSLTPKLGLDGRISEFDGAARFHTAIGIRSTAVPHRIIAIKPHIWEVPWRLPIAWDSAGSKPLPATGHTVKTSPGSGAPPKLDGPPANALQMFWLTISDPAADQHDHSNPNEWPTGVLWTVPTAHLLQYLIPARRNNAVAYSYIKGELEQRNFRVAVTCSRRAGFIGDDWVDIRLVGQRSADSDELTFNKGDTKETSAPLRLLWSDLDQIEQSTSLTVHLREYGPGRADNYATTSVPYSFDSERNVSLGNGRYTVNFCVE